MYELNCELNIRMKLDFQAHYGSSFCELGHVEAQFVSSIHISGSSISELDFQAHFEARELDVEAQFMSSAMCSILELNAPSKRAQVVSSIQKLIMRLNL